MQSERCTHVSLSVPDADGARSHIWGVLLFFCAALYLKSTSGMLDWSVLLFCFMYVEDVWRIRTR